MIIQGIDINGQSRPNFYQMYYKLLNQKWKVSGRYQELKELFDANLAKPNATLRLPYMEKDDSDFFLTPLGKFDMDELFVSVLHTTRGKWTINIKSDVLDKLCLEDTMGITKLDKISSRDFEKFKELAKKNKMVKQFLACYTDDVQISGKYIHLINAKTGKPCPCCKNVHDNNGGHIRKRRNMFLIKNFSDKCKTQWVEFRKETEDDKKKRLKDFEKKKKCDLGSAFDKTLPLNFKGETIPELQAYEIVRDRIVMSGLGTGKTKSLLASIPKGAKVLFLISGRTQAKTFAEKWNNERKDEIFCYLDEEQGAIQIKDRMVISAESLHRLANQIKDVIKDYIIVVDESEKFFGNWKNTKTFKWEYVRENIDTFTYLFKHCKTAICMDAFISRLTLDVFEDLRGKNYSHQK
jgi:hypothetical protein